MTKYYCIECNKEVGSSSDNDAYECSVCGDVFCSTHGGDHECDDGEDEEDDEE